MGSNEYTEELRRRQVNLAIYTFKQKYAKAIEELSKT